MTAVGRTRKSRIPRWRGPDIHAGTPISGTTRRTHLCAGDVGELSQYDYLHLARSGPAMSLARNFHVSTNAFPGKGKHNVMPYLGWQSHSLVHGALSKRDFGAAAAHSVGFASPVEPARTADRRCATVAIAKSNLA